MSRAVTCHRARRNKGDESISRDMLQNERLSFKARGVLAYCQSLPDTWECHGVRGIAGASDKDGYEAVNNAIKELEEAGLFARLKRQGKGAQWEWLWTYSDDRAAVAAEVTRWEGEGFRVSTKRGGNWKAKGRPDQQEPSESPEADPSDEESPVDPVSGKPEHRSPASGFAGHGSAAHGSARNKDVHSQTHSENPGGGETPPPPDPPVYREDRACAAQVVTDQGELAGDVTTRARERTHTREDPPHPRRSPEAYPEPTLTDRQRYGNTLHQACGSCGAPPDRLCVRFGDTLPLPAIRAPHHRRQQWAGSDTDPADPGQGQTRRSARKRSVRA